MVTTHETGIFRIDEDDDVEDDETEEEDNDEEDED